MYFLLKRLVLKMNRKARIEFLINRKVTNKITDEELNELFNLLSTSEFNSYVRYLSKSNKPYIDSSKDKIWQAISLNLQQENKNYFYVRKIIKVAAIFIFIFFFQILLNNFLSSDLEANLIKKVEGKDIATKYVLPDGSNIFLSRNSVITYWNNYSCNNRFLILEGKAYLDVHDSCKTPLILKTGNIYTKIDSGEINVEYKKNKIDISIKQGSLSVSDYKGAKVSCPLIKLLPASSLKNNQQINNRITYQKDSGFELKQISHKQNPFLWKDKILNFKHYNLYEVATAISEWYNIKVVIKGDVKNNEYFNINSFNPSIDSLTNMLFNKEKYSVIFDSKEKIMVISTKS